MWMEQQEKILNVNLSVAKISANAIQSSAHSMPIYELECKECKSIEEHYLPRYCDDILLLCLQCNKITSREIIPSLCSMQPDKYWSGTNTNLGYVTSQSQYKSLQKEKNFEDISPRDIEGYKKQIQRNKQEKEKAKDEARHKLAVEMCSGDDVAKDGRPITLEK
jgi:hypothetical protein